MQGATDLTQGWRGQINYMCDGGAFEIEDQRVIASTTIQQARKVGPKVDLVIAILAEDSVAAIVAVDAVIAAAAIQDIVAKSARKAIATIAAQNLIIAKTAVDGIAVARGPGIAGGFSMRHPIIVSSHRFQADNRRCLIQLSAAWATSVTKGHGPMPARSGRAGFFN